MDERVPGGWTAAERDEMWARWRRRESLRTIARHFQVYVCDPKSPWQRGTNEHTNGCLRQYRPKGADLRAFDYRYGAQTYSSTFR